jgi:adenylate cyclase
VAYVVVAAIVVQGADIIFPILLLPTWSVRLVVVIAILGLPVVIALAWMFDIELKPEEETEGADADTEIAVRPALASRMPPSLSSAAAAVAVLPFKNLSSDEKYRFVAEGIATELHSTLAKVHRLRVASRTSSFSLAGSDMDVREIARRLGVRFVITGTFECIGDHMRLIVEFDNAADGVQIWSETYDRELEDLFSIQHDVANAITSQFSGVRLREEIASASTRPTDSLDAWSLVQRARSYTLTFTPQTLSNAIPVLRRAIELDSEYAAAHAALAAVMSEQVLNGLSSDPESDRRKALESTERACSISPLDPFVLKMCGVAPAYFGEPARSITSLRRAVDVAPYDFGSWGFMGWPLAAAGAPQDLKELHEIMDRVLNTVPGHPGVPYWLYHRSVAYICEGRVDLAVSFASQSLEKNPGFPWAWMQYANALGMTKRADEARDAIHRCEEISAGLTPGHYARMVKGMSARDEVADMRLAGLRSMKVLDE